MDFYENDELRREAEPVAREPIPEEPQVPQEEPAPQPEWGYNGAGVGRRESPFADSPYVMNHQPGRYQAPPEWQPAKAPKQKKKKAGRKVWKPVLAGVLTLALVAGSCGITAAVLNNRWSGQMNALLSEMAHQSEQMDLMQQQISAAQSNPISGMPVAAGEGMTPAQVYAMNVNSVVLITCKVTTSSMYGQSTGSSSGSGFVLTDDGYVVTNHHVVEGASSVSVTTHDGSSYTAKVVGSDATNDVAVLKVEAEDLVPVTLGSSEELIVGDQVVAIGNPLGDLTATMTVGYVSAKDRDVTTDNTIINMLQTDVAINSGNSGGPLFNMRGEVVGITTAKYSGSSPSGATIEGIGFAIPIDDVTGIIGSLQNYGYVTGAYLGVSVSDVDTAAQYYGVPAGAYVAEVVDGNCAQKAGILAGDIIVKLGDFEVGAYTDLSRALRKYEPGETVEITVYRAGQYLTLDITLDEKPSQVESAPQEPQTEESMPENGNFEEWFNYFSPFFGNGQG